MAKYTANDSRIVKALGFLAMLYPRYELTEPTIAAYLRILGDLPAELVEQAAEDLGSRNTFFPAAAELRGAAFELLVRQQGIPTAYEAWGQVVKLMGSVGHYGKPQYSHEIIGRTVEAVGGWYTICMSEDGTADRARFIAAYDSLVNREKSEMRTLPGVQTFVEKLNGRKVQDAIKELSDGLSA